MAKLSVNINKIATLRNTRSIGIPDPLVFARVALESGADGITIHPRPDERHIRASDVGPVAKLVKEFRGAEFNIEGNPFEGKYVEHVQATRPTQCTLVPDTMSAVTSDHGWDLRRDGGRLVPLIAKLKSFGCRVSLFMDADEKVIEMARQVGADRVELYTAPFAEQFARGNADAAKPYAAAAKRARAAGLGVNAGHDLSLSNLGAFLRAVEGVAEVSIGHALVADALEMGFAETVKRYKSMAEWTGVKIA